MKKFSVVVALFLLLFGQGGVAGADDSFTADNMIANSLKLLGKGYVYQADLAGAKAEKTKQLLAMPPGQYKKHYREIYSYIVHTDPGFGFSQNISKEDLIEKIEALDKETIYEMIDSVPNDVIAKGFHQERDRILNEAPEGDFKDKIDFIWGIIFSQINSLKGPL